ncbi:DNA polymerase III, subunit gamma and tau [Candidatus Gottesmanbacteria bacterium RIFCSPLOWO2_01_FULL_46_9]|uniref:DNA polymerase III subunit gamma/tau n=1 Tax=Candidatus Gottesmanbacteria bacterium RIFCSPLOWO2_01_FULL_46_9 TaxID=1798394 RepID=A0A1F6B2X2_9BACT|nr:MAG: DNA polymerase III, subunit gamma and tau [Candidatus Gottesmanbacteria bacterium RIFCSPLOWO2_01_FULL_46_9]
MSFYRIYRPQVIDEIDNLAVRATLLGLLGKPKKDLPHAYLFSGPRGAGKTTAARLIAKLFNCEKPSKSSGPCGACEQCKAIESGRSLDVLEIDAASNRGIDEIRQLRDAIGLSPASAQFRIYIIDEVHMLTTEAFNALLKTLEEPPAHAVFILATTDPQKVPVTIKSRCVSLVFAKASVAELEAALMRIVKKENIDIEKAGVRRIAESVDGSFRDAVKFLEQASFHKGAITAAVIEAMFSLATSESVAEFVGNLARHDAKKSLELIEKIASSGADMKTFISQCLQHLEKLLVMRVKGESMEDALSTQEQNVLIRKLSSAFVEMRGAPIAQLPLELAVVEFCEEKNETRVTSNEKRDSGNEQRETRIEQRVSGNEKTEKKEEVAPDRDPKLETQPNSSVGSLTLEKLAEHWIDVISELKPYNHSVAGVMRSTRPKTVAGGIVTIEAFYTFHKDKLSESKTKDMVSEVLKKLFGEKVKVEVVLGKK